MGVKQTFFKIPRVSVLRRKSIFFSFRILAFFLSTQPVMALVHRRPFLRRGCCRGPFGIRRGRSVRAWMVRRSDGDARQRNVVAMLIASFVVVIGFRRAAHAAGGWVGGRGDASLLAAGRLFLSRGKGGSRRRSSSTSVHASRRRRSDRRGRPAGRRIIPAPRGRRGPGLAGGAEEVG